MPSFDILGSSKKSRLKALAIARRNAQHAVSTGYVAPQPAEEPDPEPEPPKEAA